MQRNEREAYGQNLSTVKTFAQALCERVGCAPEDYLRVAWKHSLYPQARVVFSVLPFSYARAADVKLLEQASAATSEEYLGELLREYWDDVHLNGGFLARRCKVRVSGGRLQRLFRWVMNPE